MLYCDADETPLVPVLRLGRFQDAGVSLRELSLAIGEGYLFREGANRVNTTGLDTFVDVLFLRVLEADRSLYDVVSHYQMVRPGVELEDDEANAVALLWPGAIARCSHVPPAMVRVA